MSGSCGCRPTNHAEGKNWGPLCRGPHFNSVCLRLALLPPRVLVEPLLGGAVQSPTAGGRPPGAKMSKLGSARDEEARTPLQAIVLADSFTQVCVQSFTRSVPLPTHGSLV